MVLPPENLLSHAIKTADTDPLVNWYESQLETGSPGYPVSTVVDFVDEARDQLVWEAVDELLNSEPPQPEPKRRGRPRKSA
jgi:hypothetical protein